MPDNRISATLPQADREAVMQAIATIREKLPFLVDLTIEERRSLPKLGDKSRAFVSKALEVATQNQDFLSRSFDLDEMRQDVELFERKVGVILETGFPRLPPNFSREAMYPMSASTDATTRTGG